MGVVGVALVEIERLSYRYGEDSSAGRLGPCSLAIEPGEMLLVTGPSGCGKSTLLRAVNGLVPHFYGGTISGHVRVGGLDTRDHTPAHLAHLVASVFQDPEAQIITSTVFEEVALGLENLGVAPEHIAFRAHEALDALGISHLAERSTRDLSGGEMQRVAIAAALAMRPALLVLDEPTSQLDPAAAEGLLELLRRINEDSGIAVLMAEHRLDRCFHWADRIVVMEDGRIESDAPPRESAAWSIARGNAFVPPVTRLFSGFSRNGLPLTVKEGRAELRALLDHSAGMPDAEKDRAQGASPNTAPAASPAPAPSADPVLVVRDLRHTYPNGLEALRGCSLTIGAGDVVAVMGANGAGKSTLVRHFNGLNRARPGAVFLAGRDVSGVAAEELARTCAVLGQNPTDYLFNDTVAAELEFSLGHLRPDLDAPSRAEAIRSTLAALGIDELAGAEPRALSAGQRQRVAIAAMLVAGPSVLVLDEPTRGLDWANKASLGELLRDLQRRGTTVVVVTHDIEFAAAHTDRTIVMGRGRIVADGPTDELLGSTLMLAPQVRRVLGDEFGPGIVTVEAGRQVLGEVTGRG